ncbi:LacI family DNA-binding transcriptional regulator [Herbiconiux sp. SYSU D00978]|uniref:LacI family DNA-binding transcriptional regulator n=1 Tax=Herbiconiux sp. SYSU D00978 TaxID=2812562 RepID=UPI0027DD2090|nr:LacI family DNA-binding transcriptional regulator [Herbiconiux sp. SYSU D00978]
MTTASPLSDPRDSGRKAATRTDVARYAGVSSAVVSYVLNNGPKPVAPATKARVLDAVAALHYRPNATARALKRGVADMIGMIVPDSRNPFFAGFVHAIDRAASRRGLTVLVINSDSRREDGSSHISALASHQLDGLVVADTLTEEERALVMSLGVNVVLVNQFRPDSRVVSIGVDFYNGAKEAVAHLIEHGRERVAFVGGDPGVDERERGWIDALGEAGLPPGPRVRGSFSVEAGYAAGQKLAAQRDQLDAVFVASDQLSFGLMAALHEAGLTIPADVAVASFDGSSESRYLCPPLTTVRQPVDEMADAAIDALLDTSRGAAYVDFPTTLIRRQSCGCHPASS